MTAVTWDPSHNTGMTLTNGNLDAEETGQLRVGVRSTISRTDAPVYFEYDVILDGTDAGDIYVGVCADAATLTFPLGDNKYHFSWRGLSGAIEVDGSAISAVTGASYVQGDRLGVAYVPADGRFWLRKNGTWLGTGANPDTLTNPVGQWTIFNQDFIYYISDNKNQFTTVKVGIRPSTGSFVYSIPSGFAPFEADVSVALTGVSGIGSPGSMLAVELLAISTAAGTGSVGTLGLGSQSFALSGVAGTAALGTLVAGNTEVLSGNGVTGSPGSLTFVSGPVLSSVSATGALGSFGLSLATAMTGVTGTGSTGLLSSGGGLLIALTSVSATGSVDTLVPGITLAVSGNLGSGGVGTLFAGGAVVGYTIDSPIILTPTILGGTIRPNAAGYKANDGSAGINATITTASLSGKTITVKDGIITGFS